MVISIIDRSVADRKPKNDTHSYLGGDGLGTSSRLRRIMIGEEFILTPESVNELSNFVMAPEPLGAMHKSDEHLFPFWEISQQLQPNPTNDLSYSLLFRPNSPNVASGLTYSLKYPTFNGFDAFSALPETEGEPVPKELLIRYCKPLPTISVEAKFTQQRCRETGTMAQLPRR